ncbi:MAG: glycosyltransferase family 2 protein [Calditrichaceae bacterium]|nr:glycosyltransferase family 2 protein [Calditrichaceae bacterium]
MKDNHKIAVIIPALNEERSIGKVIGEIPAWVDEIVVVDNGSSDRTMEIARAAGARALQEPERGYGAACLTGIAALRAPDIVVFLDGDYSDYPEEMAALVQPIIEDQADMVIGSRVLGKAERGALSPQQAFGNWLACRLMRLFWGVRYTDLGPFRAIRYSTLQSLEMRDRNYGWTVEMQIKAAQRGVGSREVPVRYRRRIGKSKVSGTLRGVISAGAKILFVIFLSAWEGRFRENNLLRNAGINETSTPPLTLHRIKRVSTCKKE